MGFFSRLLRFLLWVAVLSWSVAMLRRAVNWMLHGVNAGSASKHVGGPEGSPPKGTRRLVRDPVCGVHVAEVLSIPLRDGDELVHFCSTACRDRYLAGTKKFVANAS